MSSLRTNGRADVLGEPGIWIDSSESTTRNETVKSSGMLTVGLRPESAHAATVTVSITDAGGQENTCTITSKSNETIPVPAGSKVRVTYTADEESHATVSWTPMGAS
ncbi:hypothetical protein AB0D94_22720 [Streptomyces sp. NPDC048255]|uniref:hypothetical protein n=1 Tax=Streptomyces sp. NPDC048255 TaxID=3154713 RepID=UPI0033E9B429